MALVEYSDIAGYIWTHLRSRLQLVLQVGGYLALMDLHSKDTS